MRVPRWWAHTYIIDYVVTLILFIVLIVLYAAAPTYNMAIPIDDTGDRNNDLLFPYKKSTIPEALMIIIIGFPVVLCVLAVQWKYRSLHDLHNFILCLLEVLALSTTVVEFGKHFAGRNRPHYYAHVGADSEDVTVSYPSGHSSISFACFTILAMYLAGKLKTFRDGSLLKFMASAVWIVGAWAVAITRTRDYHHNFSDINAGSMIGMISAFCVYFLNYPSLFNKKCDLPLRRNKNEEISEY